MTRKTDFLQTYFTDCQTEMRWRRDVEYKLLSSLLPLYPALVGGLLALNAILSRHIVLGTAIVLGGFVCIVQVYVERKLQAEHDIYKALGMVVVKIWDHYGFFQKGAYLQGQALLKEGSRKYGAGRGYQLTINLLRSISFATTGILLGIGLLAHYEQL